MTNTPPNRTTESAATEGAAKPKKKPVQNRDSRLKAALKANMAKRKSQARARTVANSQENEAE